MPCECRSHCAVSVTLFAALLFQSSGIISSTSASLRSPVHRLTAASGQLARVLVSSDKMLVVDCATTSTLQELKKNKSSGVFAYEETDDFQSVTSNRYIAWRTCDDILELSEHSLNKNLVDSVLKIQFKNTLILEKGVSIHETPDRIYVLVTTLVSAHRFAFSHPNKLHSNPSGISSGISYLNNTAGASQSSTTDLLVYSIFHNVSVDNSVGNSCQLPNSTSQNTMLGTASSPPFLASCSWINSSLEAYFVVSKKTGSLYVVKLPSPFDNGAEPKVHTIDLKQNSFIGMTMNLITGIVPSLKSISNGAEAAISLLSHSTPDDDLIFALCKDSQIRVLSLKKQECIIVHDLLSNQQQLQSQLHSPSANFHGRDGIASPPGSILRQPSRTPMSIKLWWHGDDTNTLLPNLVVHLCGDKHKSFFFFETVIRQRNSTSQVHQSQSASMNASYSAAHTVANQTSPHLKFLLEVVAPVEQELIDYFVSDNQIWALMQHNDVYSLQYYSIESPNCPAQIQGRIHPPLEWMPVISNVNPTPEMEVFSLLCNSREYYLKEIFWRGHFSLSTIAKAINVSNRVPIDEEKINSTNLKIDQLMKEANNLVDSFIRTQIDKNQFEFTVEKYTEMESKAWKQLYAFCLEYHAEENKPLSIFVDYKTGAKGVVRRGKIDFIPALDPFDELIDYYFLLCKESSSQVDLPYESALDYRLNTLMAPLDGRIAGVFASALQQSIRELLVGMSAISKTLSEEDLINFAALMNRMSSFSSKSSKTLADIAKMIAEDSLLPEMTLADNPGQDIDDFFTRCPMVVEAINFLLSHINFSFTSNSADFPFNLNVSVDGDVDENVWKMQEALQYEIKPMFSNLLSSRCGLGFVVSSVSRIVNMRYKFCRDLFLFQYFLNKFRLNLRADYMTKITQIEADTIPNTTQQLFALDYLSWASQTPMINPNIWWGLSEDQTEVSGLTSIVSANNTSPPKNTLKSASGNTSSLENSELLSVLELREYINLNRIGILSHESTFYDAYPHSTILHFFIQFSGGILAKRLISYKLTVQHGNDLSPAINNIWSMIVSNYLCSVGQLLWPLSDGQLKLGEFLLGVAHYDLLERFNQRLHWCIEHPNSRLFLKGICSLVTGEGHKAIRHLEQALSGVDYELFLSKIFSKKAARKVHDAKSLLEDGGDEPSNGVRIRAIAHENEDVRPNSRTIFRYYNKLIQLFKRYSSPDHVIELVDVAINSLDPKSDPEYDEHQSSLGSTLFACHLQLGNVEKAYDAMINNTDADQRRICLRQFILNLCETGDLASLVAFSYQRLEDEFVSILEWKARTSSARFFSGKHFHALDNYSTTSRLSASTAGSDLSASLPINYHHILYTYFIKMNNYRRAAQSMYDYYRQLNKEANTFATSDCVELLQKQADALLIARNCLKLVDPNYSWIIKNALKRTDGASDLGAQSKQKLKRKHGNTTDFSHHQEKTIIDIVDDDELWCEFELVNARLRLLQRNPKEYAIASTILSPEETVILCIGACLYEHAFRISSQFKLPLESIFDGMASKYVQLLNGAYNRRRIDDEMVLALLDGEIGVGGNPFSQYSNDPLASPTHMMQSFNIDLLDIFYENGSNAAKSSFISYSTLSICDRMWHLIMHYLERYETRPESSSHLMKQVAEKLLSNGIMLPASLLKVYQKVNCPEVIRLFITYNFLPEATQVSLDYMNAFMGHGTEYFDIIHHLYGNCPPMCIPLHIFDCLLKILREASEESKLDQWQNRLASDDSTDPLHGVISSVDDYVNEEKIDYEELYKNLSKRKQKLHDAIVSCSS